LWQNAQINRRKELDDLLQQQVFAECVTNAVKLFHFRDLMQREPMLQKEVASMMLMWSHTDAGSEVIADLHAFPALVESAGQALQGANAWARTESPSVETTVMEYMYREIVRNLLHLCAWVGPFSDWRRGDKYDILRPQLEALFEETVNQLFGPDRTMPPEENVVSVDFLQWFLFNTQKEIVDPTTTRFTRGFGMQAKLLQQGTLPNNRTQTVLERLIDLFEISNYLPVQFRIQDILKRLEIQFPPVGAKSSAKKKKQAQAGEEDWNQVRRCTLPYLIS
jgi:hypothetical protein